MTTKVIHRAETRGHADHGWLKANHTFSFAGYHDPSRVHFGVLRVLNDDTVEGGRGFGMHPHDNMEIITIPLEGDLQHKDSMGNSEVIRHGDVQVMSAGTGILHSEINPNPDRQVKLLQIWLFPNKKNVEPRYGQMTLDLKDRHNKLQQVVSPDPDDAGLWIHQNAWFHIGKFDKGQKLTYNVRKDGNGMYAFMIEGSATIAGESLNKRDGMGITETAEFEIIADTDCEVLLMDVPMN